MQLLKRVNPIQPDKPRVLLPPTVCDIEDKTLRLIYGEMIYMHAKQTGSIAEIYIRSAKDFPVAIFGGPNFDTSWVGSQATAQLRLYTGPGDIDFIIDMLWGKAERAWLVDLAKSRRMMHISKVHSLTRGVGNEIMNDILGYAQKNGFDIITVATITPQAHNLCERFGFVHYWTIHEKQKEWVGLIGEREGQIYPRATLLGSAPWCIEYLSKLLKLNAEIGNQTAVAAIEEILRRIYQGDAVFHLYTNYLAALAGSLPQEYDGKRVAAHRIWEPKDIFDNTNMSLIRVNVPKGCVETAFSIPGYQNTPS